MNEYASGELFGITIYLDKDVEQGVLEPDDNEKWAWKVHPLTWEAIKKELEPVSAPPLDKEQKL